MCSVILSRTVKLSFLCVVVFSVILSRFWLMCMDVAPHPPPRVWVWSHSKPAVLPLSQCCNPTLEQKTPTQTWPGSPPASTFIAIATRPHLLPRHGNLIPKELSQQCFPASNDHSGCDGLWTALLVQRVWERLTAFLLPDQSQMVSCVLLYAHYKMNIFKFTKSCTKCLFEQYEQKCSLWKFINRLQWLVANVGFSKLDNGLTYLFNVTPTQYFLFFSHPFPHPGCNIAPPSLPSCSLLLLPRCRNFIILVTFRNCSITCDNCN